jgi:hypothetical protein
MIYHVIDKEGSRLDLNEEQYLKFIKGKSFKSEVSEEVSEPNEKPKDSKEDKKSKKDKKEDFNYEDPKDTENVVVETSENPEEK